MSINFFMRGENRPFNLRDRIGNEEEMLNLQYLPNHHLWMMVGNMFTYQGRNFFVDIIQDVNNEPENKRIQGRIIFDAIHNNADVVGLYPVFDLNDNLRDVVFVVWENGILPNHNTRNPSLKVKVDAIKFCFDSNQIVEADEMEYTALCYPSSIFNSEYLV